MKNVIDRVHKRALRILFNDYISSFEELLQKISSDRIYVKILQCLMIEIFNSYASRTLSNYLALIPSGLLFKIQSRIPVKMASALKYFNSCFKLSNSSASTQNSTK